MRCQSPHEAALGEKALPDRPAICYSSFREVSDSLQWTVHSLNTDGVTQPTNRLGAAPKIAELPVIF